MATHGLPVELSPAYETVAATRRLVAFDLVASGAQDREREAVLEVATVPVLDWEPHVCRQFTTMINPIRPIPRRPWIAPGLSDTELRAAPVFADILPDLAERINATYIVGYNVGASWRVLRQAAPGLRPAGLIDVLRLARAIDPGHRHDLASVIDQLGLSDAVTALAGDSAPGRALWNCVAAGALLTSLARPAFGRSVSIAQLLAVAGVASQRPRHLGASDWRNDLIPLRPPQAQAGPAGPPARR
jgi:DNA polymerase-3 subunit epsilon